jgi:hypothetical protein
MLKGDQSRTGAMPMSVNRHPRLLTPRQVQLTEGQFPLPSVLTWTGPDEVINAVTILTERLAPALDVVRATSHTDSGPGP